MNQSLQTLIAYAKRSSGRVKSRTLGDRLRKIARGFGPTNPVGDTDAKTGTPGTYRPVGSTCPLSCKHHPENDGTCYALFANVNLHQRRAKIEVEAALRAAEVAIVWATTTDRVARLHVSGDFGRTVAQAMPYLMGLIAICQTVGGTEHNTVAWTYTALPLSAETLLIARQAGLSIRLSGHNGHNGAIVYPHATIEHLPAPANYRDYIATPLACPAQRTKNAIDCQTCKACWARPNRTIVFDPHGPAKKRATARALA